MFGTLGLGAPGVLGLVSGIREPGDVLLGLVLLGLPEQFSLSIRTDVTRRCCSPVSAPTVPDVPAVAEELRRELRDVRRSGITVPITSTCWPTCPSSAEPSRMYEPLALLEPMLLALLLAPDALFSMYVGEVTPVELDCRERVVPLVAVAPVVALPLVPTVPLSLFDARQPVTVMGCG